MEDVEIILQKKVEESSLNELVVVQKLTDDPVSKSDYVQINVKSLSKEIIDMITHLELLRKSRCFIAEWKDTFKGMHMETTISLHDMYERVYCPLVQRLYVL